jgi:L-seryl-tRNA(Ser) seleniumtransferase
MRDGAGSFVDPVELQRRVGGRIAELTSNDACYVSSGAAAGAIAIAACITGGDPPLSHGCPLDGLPVIIHRAHRNGYDRPRDRPGRGVEIGMAHGTQRWELEAAFATNGMSRTSRAPTTRTAPCR